MSDRYDVGYRDGESNRQADWDLALGEITPDLPEDVEWTPAGIAAYITSLRSSLARVEAEIADWSNSAYDRYYAEKVRAALEGAGQ